MTNEELVIMIQQGDDGRLPQLWEQVRKFVVIMAKRHNNKLENKYGCELDDLIQSGYFGVIEAIQYYRPERGLKFISYLDFNLRNAFNEALGIRTSKRDWLDYSDSLDRPIGEDGDTALLDVIGDLTPKKADIEELVAEDVWNQELRVALNKAMTVLSEKQRKLLTMIYYFGMTFEQIAEIRECSRQNIVQGHRDALERIYRSKYRKLLAGFLPHNNYKKDPYQGTGYNFWKEKGLSSAEAFLIHF